MCRDNGGNIMAKPVLMPKLSSTMTHGSVTEWFVEEGDVVEVGQPIFEVLTDKIAIEVESYEEGILLKRYVGVLEEVPINSIIAYIGEEGESVPNTMDFAEEGETKVEAEVVEEVSVESTPEAKTEVPETKGIRATPYARKLAREKDIDLSRINGSGRFGRVQAQDVINYKVPTTEVTTSVEAQTEFIPWQGMRKAVKEAMTNSKQTIPHVTMNATVRINKLLEIRRELNSIIEDNITITDMFSLAVIKTLKNFPEFNARSSEEGVRRYQSVNLGIAVALDDGLVVPVIQTADTLSLLDISRKTKALAEGARDNKLLPDDYKNGTFSISSLGRTVVRNFNPIINYPEVAILGIGGMYKTNEESYIDISLSFDHRVVDGYPASQFLNHMVSILENPTLMIL